MRHTLEHFLNPISVLQKAFYALSPKGVLYIAVPNMMKPHGSLDDFWFRIVHTYYFSKWTLIQTCAKANLKPIRINSKDSELWGTFNKGKFILKSASVYNAQIKVINNYRRLLKINFFPRKVASLIPDSIRENIIINVKEKMRHLC